MQRLLLLLEPELAVDILYEKKRKKEKKTPPVLAVEAEEVAAFAHF